jgi:hypothetical protein
MNTKLALSLLVSVVVGVAITLISGLIQTPMAHLGVDVVYWGMPLPWTMRVIPTQFQSIDWLNLIADLAFWVIIASIVSTSLMYLATKRKSADPTSAPRTK